MTQLLYLLIAAACFCVAMSLVLVFVLRHEREKMDRRSAAIITPYLSALEGRAAKSVRMMDAFSSLGRKLRSRIGNKETRPLKSRLEAAGYYSERAADIYVGIRVLLPCMAVAFVAFLTHNWVVLIGAFGLGFLLPDFALDRLVRARREAIRKSLPDTVDLLVICMDAGLGIDSAINQVSEVLYVSYPEMCSELNYLVQIQQMGTSKADAWQAVVERTKSPDLEQLARMLQEAEQFGTPITEQLRIMADSLRTELRQRVEEYAAKTGIYLLIPLVVFIFPVLFVVLMGPAVISLMHGISSFTH